MLGPMLCWKKTLPEPMCGLNLNRDLQHVSLRFSRSGVCESPVKSERNLEFGTGTDEMIKVSFSLSV